MCNASKKQRIVSTTNITCSFIGATNTGSFVQYPQRRPNHYRHHYYLRFSSPLPQTMWIFGLRRQVRNTHRLVIQWFAVFVKVLK